MDDSNAPNIGHLRVFTDVLPSFLWPYNISTIFLLMVPLDERLDTRTPLVIVAIYKCLSLLGSLSSPLVYALTVSEENFPLGDSSFSPLSRT